jgi:Domain of unknown function (DUF1707)
VSDSWGLRVADADREQLAEDLREHMLAGRLTPEEFEERLGRAYKATTRGELDALKVDLPMSPAGLQVALAKRKSNLRRRLFQESGGAVTISAVCVAIWLASGADGSFWPIWVIVATLLPLVRNAWRLFGPDPDLDAVEAQMASRRARRLAHEERRSRHRELPR